MSEYIKISPIDVKKYGGNHVVLVDGNGVAPGRTSEEVWRKARKDCPDRPLSEIPILAVPNTISTLSHV